MTATASAPPRYKRSVKNYLIDARFQLKYTGMIIIVALAISAFLGVFLSKTSDRMVREGQRVVLESKKVSDVVRMGMTKDPIYAENPELQTAFNEDANASDRKIEAQQQALVHQQETMTYALVSGLSLMVLLIGILGIYFTHKVAGPIYKMKLLLRQVGDGKLNFHGKLRKGDELQDFFETFAEMVEKLKDRQRNEIGRLETALVTAKAAGAPETSLSEIAGVRDEMKASLDL